MFGWAPSFRSGLCRFICKNQAFFFRHCSVFIIDFSIPWWYNQRRYTPLFLLYHHFSCWNAHTLRLGTANKLTAIWLLVGGLKTVYYVELYRICCALHAISSVYVYYSVELRQFAKRVNLLNSFRAVKLHNSDVEFVCCIVVGPYRII